MPDVRAVYRKLEALRDSLPTIAENSVKEVKSEYEESQKHQMEEGVSADGSRMQYQKSSHYPYTKQYANYKAKQGLQTKVVDLKLSGRFYQGIVATVENGRLKITSTDDKTHFLKDNYNGVFGLNRQEMHDFLHGFVKPSYQKNILDFLKR